MGTVQGYRRPTVIAQRLRREATPAERLLWTGLGNRRLAGHKFSRQMPVGPYVVDFLCREARLVVEVDGFSHESRIEHDAKRERFLRDHGLTVLRFTNADVLDNLGGLLTMIEGELKALPTPRPSRKREGSW